MEILSQQMIDSLINGGAESKNEEQNPLTDIEIDALAESVNISMGSASKALSTMLNMKVVITTPNVAVVKSEEFEYKSLFPAVGVRINYIEGLTGSNFLVMKQSDVRTIVNIMMGGASDTDDAGFSELYTSAICEVMNQMMGASSTSLASFFDMKINISTPESIIVEENVDAKDALNLKGTIIVIKLRLKIGDVIDSEFVNVMPVEFAKALAVNLINTKLSPKSEEPEAAEPKAQPKHENNSSSNKIQKSSENKNNYRSMDFTENNFGVDRASSQQSNLDIIMDVPLEIIVQIGKTRRPVKEIIEFSQGSVIELEKQAGDPVDILVNGELIAKGDVVVIDDNFGVRITEILTAEINR